MRPGEVIERRDRGEDWQLLDVREPWELALVSLPDAIAIPMAEVPQRHGELDRDRPVAVLCHSGIRSLRVARYLVGLGYARVANVGGGIDAWSREVDVTLPRY